MDTSNTNSQTTPPPPQQPQEQPKETVREIHHHHYRERSGLFPRIFWGIFIIFVGLMFLAQTTGAISGADIGRFFSMIWPVFIILIGLSILSRGGFVSGLVSVIILIITLALVAVFAFGVPGFRGANRFYINDRTVQVQDISLDKQAGAQSADITISAGAGQITISGSTDKLVSGSLQSDFAHLTTSSQFSGTTQSADIKTEGNWVLGSRKNDLDLKLTSSTPVNLTMNVGAATENLDFSEINLPNLSIHTGASTLNLTMGDKTDSKVNLDAGASTVNITLPKTLGAKVFVDSGMSSKNFADFKQLDSHTYQSNNYDQATRKIELNLRGGASSLNINWK